MGSNSYLVFSLRGQDYLSVPTLPSRLRRLGVKFYKEISARRRLFKVVIRLAMIARVHRLVGHELSTPVPKYPNFPFDSWLEQARRDLGSTDAQAVVSFPGQLNRGRFYVNLLSPDGEPLAFAKVSRDAKDGRRLVTETGTHRHLAGQTIRSFRVPKVLAEGKFDSHQHLIMQAMPARGVPLIDTRVNRMDQIIAGCGVAVEPRDEKALATAMEQLLTDRDLYFRLTVGCHKKAEEFNSEKNLKKLHRSIRRCLAPTSEPVPKPFSMSW